MKRTWLRIHYREFYDIPRAFVAEYDGRVYLFDCLFSDELDDYEDAYTVYVVPDEFRERLGEISWTELRSRSLHVGQVSTDSVQFDSTKRQLVDARVFESVCREAKPAE